jgi:hypothetical protein
MADFEAFHKDFELNYTLLLTEGHKLYQVACNPDELWSVYLESFPPGSNEIYKERREHDCNCCRSFIRNFGNLVYITQENEIGTIWDFDTAEPYATVVKALDNYIRTKNIDRPFFATQRAMGQCKSNHSLDEDTGKVVTFHHFFLTAPKENIQRDATTLNQVVSTLRSTQQVCLRSLIELTTDSVEVVLDLIAQGSLYRGDEFKSTLQDFLKTKKNFDKLTTEQKQINFSWLNIGKNFSRIRNTAIGTLLIDLSAGVELDEAVRKYERVMAPANYKRPKPIFTKRMIEEAKKTIQSLDLEDSLPRKFAAIEEVSVNDVLFVNRDSRSKMRDSVFDDLVAEAKTNKQKHNFDKVEEINVEDFINNVLPSAHDIEIMIENRHVGNFMSIVGPQNPDSKPLFKWDNNFCWVYNGDVADSIKENVKRAGGDVEGFMRFSIQWNESGRNNCDYDAHCMISPNSGGKSVIYYGHQFNKLTEGCLDVDVINPGGKIAVENITFPSKDRLVEGNYKFSVDPFSIRSGNDGFSAEFEINGDIRQYEYFQPLPRKSIDVLSVNYDKKKGFTVTDHLPSQQSSREVWGIKTNDFVKVSCMMLSPNFWHGAAFGNKHYCFILDGCKNENQPRGFLNEFLKEDFNKHRKVFEALGSKMRVPESDNQLSGVAFSSTKNDEVVVRVSGKFQRVLKVKF